MKKIKKYNIVYETTCLINNKIYIGVHKTNNLEDGYIGCGIYKQENVSKSDRTSKFHNAVRKHGYHNFKRTILCMFNTYEAALILEKILVDEKFLERKDVYNTNPGGKGGWPSMPGEKNGFYNKKHKPESIQLIKDKLTGRTLPLEVRLKVGRKGRDGWNTGKKMPEEFCKKISLVTSGENHPSFGKFGEDNPKFGHRRSEQDKRNTRIAKFTRECFTFCFIVMMSDD